MKRLSLKRVCPVWILTSLRGEEFKKFKAQVDNQFSTFSESEIDDYKSVEKHKWWEVTPVDESLSEKWNHQTGIPYNIPVFECQGLFDGTQVEVIFHSPISDFKKDVEYVKALKENKQFLENYIHSNRLFYGIISFRKEESKKQYFVDDISCIEKVSDNLFESVIFHSDSSQDASNPYGYLSLDDDDFMALSVSLVFATALMKVTLTSVANQIEKRFHMAGCFSLVYEPDAFKCNKSANLSTLLMDAFCNNETDSEWFDPNEALLTFENSSIKKNLHWRLVYNQLFSNFNEEKLDGIYTKPPISPWAMLAYRLKPEYFKKYLKSLLKTVYEKVHDFGAITLMRFKSFTDLRYEQLLAGTAPIDNGAQYAKSAIVGFVEGLWSPDNKGAKGLKQAQLLVATLKDYLIRQKEEVERVRIWSQPNDKDYLTFPKPNEYPLQEIFDDRSRSFTSFYEEEAMNHPSPLENTPEINKRREFKELTDVHRILQYHPMPLNLFAKLALLAALLPVTIWVILMVIPDYLFNSTYFESGMGLTIMYVIIAALALIWGYVQYAINILRKIRIGIRRYVAWYFYQIERQTYLVALQKESDYYDEMITECSHIEDRLRSFIEAVAPKLPEFEKYHTSKLQRNILGNLDNGTSILKDFSMLSELKIEDHEYSLDVLTPGLFNALIETCDRNMGDIIFSMLLIENDSMSDSKYLLMMHWILLLAEKIKIYLNSREIPSNISKLAFDTIGEERSNFNYDAAGMVCATMYPSVYVPTERPHTWTSIYVSDLGGEGKKWESLYTGDVMLRIPNYIQGRTGATMEPEQIALFLRMHSFQTLLSKDGETIRTIFN